MKLRPSKVIFERTTLIVRGDRFIVYDRYGRVVLPVTMYLLHLLMHGRSVKTVHQYGRQIVSILRVLEVSSIGLFEVHDGTLLLLRDHAIHVRGAKIKTWKSTLSTFLKMLDFAQKQKFCTKAIGVNVDGGTRYRISLVPGGGVRHELLNERGEGYEIPDLPPDEDFDLVEAELTSARTWALQKQRQAMVDLFRGGPLRRSELVKFEKNDLPSRVELERRVERMGKKGSPALIEIRFWRAKKENDRRRSAYMAVELVRELINFRDKVRPLLLKEDVDPPALFVSMKTGRAYNEQSITNLVKTSARRAASKYGQHLKAIRPHFYRHRAVTTQLKHLLAAGMDAVQAFLQVMDGMDASFDTMCIYLHIAQHELDAASPEFHRASMALNDLATLRRRFYHAIDAGWRKGARRG